MGLSGVYNLRQRLMTITAQHLFVCSGAWNNTIVFFYLSKSKAHPGWIE
jgi:hypothetical protein